MRLMVSPEIVKAYPSLRIAYVTVRGMDNTGTDEQMDADMRAAEQDFRSRYPDVNRLGADCRIAAWRQVYQSFRVNPSRFRPSAEAFLRRIIRGDTTHSISKAVNAYLLSETSYLLPVGGYDLARIAGDIGLRYSDGGEPFIPIGGVEQEETDPGEIVYADDRRILTRRWNYRDCDHAKITGSSREIALFIEAPLPSVNTEDIQKQIELIASRVVTSCGGASTTGMLDVKEGSELVL